MEVRPYSYISGLGDTSNLVNTDIRTAKIVEAQNKISEEAKFKISKFLKSIESKNYDDLVRELRDIRDIAADESEIQEIFEFINRRIKEKNLSSKRKRSLIALTELIFKEDMNIPDQRLIRILKQTKDINKVKLIAKRKNLTPKVKKIASKKWANLYKGKKNWLYFLGKAIIDSKKTNEPVKEVVLEQNNFAKDVFFDFIRNILFTTLNPNSYTSLDVKETKFVIDKILEKFGKRQMSLISLSETRKILNYIVNVARQSCNLPPKELIIIETKVLDKLRYANNLENKRKTSKNPSLETIESLRFEAEILKNISLDMKNYCENSPKKAINAQKEVVNLSSKIREILKPKDRVNDQKPEIEDKKIIEEKFGVVVKRKLVPTTLKDVCKDISDNLSGTQSCLDEKKFGLTKKRLGFLNSIRRSRLKRKLREAGI